jgi:ribonuclease HI
MAAKPGGYYAVRTGRVPGIYRTWAECEQQVLHFPNARYKRFNSEQEAQRFIAYDVHADNNSSSSSNNNSTPTQQQTISSPRQISLQSTTVPIGYTGSTTVVYTDGSCLSNGKGDGVAVAGIGVFFGDGDVRNLAEPLAGARQTNQRAEITAAIRALELLHGTRGDVEIRTDSHYVIKGIICIIYSSRKCTWDHRY